MIYCIANQLKNAIFAEKWGGKASEKGQKAFIWGGKPPNWGGKPPNWHIYFSHYGYFKEIGH